MKRCRFVHIWIFLVTVRTCWSFNLDLEKRRFLQGANNSYFGFSLDIVESKSSVLVGAPLGEDATMPTVRRPGVIYRCDLEADLDKVVDCQPMIIDSKTGNDNNGRVFFKHGKDDQWLGVTLKASSTGVITCAHRWVNKNFEETYSEFFMNGFCYEIPIDLVSPVLRILPLVLGSKQTATRPTGETFYNYGMANMGMSVHYTASNQDLLIGAPGLKDWTGGFVDFKVTTGYVMNSDVLRIDSTQDRLLGYAVSSGRYFADRVTYFAVGEPRYLLTGRVVLFDSDQTEFSLENRDLVIDGTTLDLTSKEELPMNSYFGASLCSEDVNKDGFDDLIVGAPLYTQPPQYGSVETSEEEGRVFLFLGTTTPRPSFSLVKKPLSGGNSFRSRFGTAIASLGDVNRDGFNDIAVGAPYEMDGGAVYVYNGFAGGLWPMFSQRIVGKQLDPVLTGFGMSFSRAIDLNGDDINDISIGAYASDRAVVLYGKPVLDMTASLVGPEEIEKDTRTFHLKTCFQYNYRDCDRINLALTLRLDDQYHDDPRLVFENSGAAEKQMSFGPIFQSNPTCEIHKISVKSTRDLVAPLHVSVEYGIENIRCSSTSVKPTINRFKGGDPKDPRLMMTKIVNFKKDCPDNICRTDLTIRANPLFDDVDGAFIIGTPSLDMLVEVTKSGDPSYGTMLLFTYSKFLSYKKVVKVSGETEVSCQFEDVFGQDGGSFLTGLKDVIDEWKENLLVCFIGNPLANDTGVEFKLQLQVPDRTTPTELRFGLNVTTLSNETDPSDNTQRLRIDVRNHVTTTFSGISTPDFILVRDTSEYYNTDHVYELGNQGPSPLPAARFNVYFPQVQTEDMVQLYVNSSTMRCRPPCQMECEIRNHGDASKVIYTWYRDGWILHRPMSEQPPFTEIKALDCRTSTCALFGCSVRNLPPRESAVLSMTFHIHRSILSIASAEKSTKIYTKGVVKLDESTIITDTASHTSELFTELVSPTIPVKPVDWWIPVTSALFGVALVALIIVVLWKCGFFKRKKREELEKRKLVEDDKQSAKTEEEVLTKDEGGENNGEQGNEDEKKNGTMDEVEI